MKLVKIMFNAPPELKKMVKIQAAMNDKNLTDYIIGLIKQDLNKSKLSI